MGRQAGGLSGGRFLLASATDDLTRVSGNLGLGYGAGEWVLKQCQLGIERCHKLVPARLIHGHESGQVFWWHRAGK